MKLWYQIKDAMKHHLQQCICEENIELTYREVIDQAERFAKSLKGVPCCAIMCKSELHTALALLSCLASETTAVPISVRYGERQNQAILEAIDPPAVITDDTGVLGLVERTRSQYEIPHSHPALIMCTSGTTGHPKGAMLSESNILSNLRDICQYFKIDETDAILINRPLYHCAVLTGEFLVGLINGLQIRFLSSPFHPPKTLSLMAQHRITVMGGTPTTMRALGRFQKNKPSQVSKLIVSGECLTETAADDILHAFPKAEIYHVYGLTEASPRVCALPPELFSQFPCSVGMPLASVQLQILREDGMTADAEEEGILWVKGPNVMMGYYRNPTVTKKVICDGWLCTGDMAVLDSRGLLYIRGRQDDMIIRAGMNIYPQEIESALMSDERVQEVVAFGFTSNAIGTQIGLSIVGSFQSVDDVRRLCMKVLPSYQVPSHIELTDRLPKGPSGKLIRRSDHAGI